MILETIHSGFLMNNHFMENIHRMLNNHPTLQIIFFVKKIFSTKNIYSMCQNAYYNQVKLTLRPLYPGGHPQLPVTRSQFSFSSQRHSAEQFTPHVLGGHLSVQWCPVQPGRQMQSPLTGSQVALFSHSHLLWQFLPYVPLEHFLSQLIIVMLIT